MAPVQASIESPAIQSATGTGCMKGAVRVDGISSMKRPGAKAGVQVVMATGKAAWTKARPTRAGFITLNPRPPNRALPSPMPVIAATAAIQSGKPGGRVRPSRSPVITADQSLTVSPSPPRREKSHSVATAARVVVSSRSSALRPNW